MNPTESHSPVLVPGPLSINYTDPEVRQQLRGQLRAEEWDMHRKLMVAAQTALDNFLSNPHRITANDIARLAELGFDLGRSACGLAHGQSDEAPPRGPTLSLEFRAAVEKIYGRPVPPEFIDADEVVPVTTAGANEQAGTTSVVR